MIETEYYFHYSSINKVKIENDDWTRDLLVLFIPT